MTRQSTSGAFNLVGGVVDATSFAKTPNVSGAFAFQATYSGDNTYNGSTGPCEALAVDSVPSTTVTVIHDASHTVVTSVPAGTTVHDQATVTGSVGIPTGTVVFKWFTNGTCASAPSAMSLPVALDGSGIADATGFPQTPNAGGSFAFQAVYSGDATYNASTGSCEPLTVTKLTSSTATDIHDAAHQIVTSVPAGTTVHDQATVTGSLGDPDRDRHVQVVHQRDLLGRTAVDIVAAGVVGRSRRRHVVHADAERVGELRVPGDLLGRQRRTTVRRVSVSRSAVDKVSSTTVTDIHNASHQVVTIGACGDDGARPGDGDRFVADADRHRHVHLVHERYV